ncbi:hypothetical protein M5E87_08115 [Flavonifractor plautii]|nr:hypothetical protein M5E87_08115 [Flavonifractor plautii]
MLLQVPGGDVYVLAQDLAESVCKAAGIDYAACTVLATLKGSAFELMRAKHPSSTGRASSSTASTSPWTLTPAASTPPPASAQRTSRSASSTTR